MEKSENTRSVRSKQNFQCKIVLTAWSDLTGKHYVAGIQKISSQGSVSEEWWIL
jgi:hypothetical protein